MSHIRETKSSQKIPSANDFYQFLNKNKIEREKKTKFVRITRASNLDEKGETWLHLCLPHKYWR